MAASAKPVFTPTKETYIAGFTLVAITLHLVLVLRFAHSLPSPPTCLSLPRCWPAAYHLSGNLLKRLASGNSAPTCSPAFPSLTAILLGEYLVATIVVLMLSGGEALEEFATARASSVLDALARRMPSIAHRKQAGELVDVKLAEIRIGDELTVLPHEICPVDGTVLEGHGMMDEAYLTGEPYEISKTPGSTVISGAINGETLLLDSRGKTGGRFALRPHHESDARYGAAAPQLRRLGDQLGAWYTPLALWRCHRRRAASRTIERFLAVVVIATPCPLLLAIPTAIIGAISLAARRAIIIKNPAVLEQIEKCRTLIFDKTGTLTYGRPKLTEVLCAEGISPRTTCCSWPPASEQYSKHPLASAIVSAASRNICRSFPWSTSANGPAKACSPPSKAIPFKSPADNKVRRYKLQLACNSSAAWSAWYSLTKNTPRPSAFTTLRARTPLPSFSICSQNTAWQE